MKYYPKKSVPIKYHWLTRIIRSGCWSERAHRKIRKAVWTRPYKLKGLPLETFDWEFAWHLQNDR